MVRGYSGFYNNIYLRSSLEFAFAYYLDYKNIKWKYEEFTYKLKDRQYKPDFFIYDNNDNLIEIIEIKGKENKIDGLKKIQEFNQIYNIPIKLIEYKDLLEIYKKEMPIRLHKAKKIFIEEYNSKLIDQNMLGKLNPMYGLKQSEKTKKIIGDKCKIRFQDDEYKEKFKESLKKRTYKSGYQKSRREERLCLKCGKSFIVTVNSKRKYCSKKCAGKVCIQKAIEKNELDYINNKEIIKNFILNWVKDNKDLILNCKYNKISTTLQPLYELIEKEFNILDKRTISNIFDTDSRKEFLLYLKEYVTSENVC